MNIRTLLYISSPPPEKHMKGILAPFNDSKNKCSLRRLAQFLSRRWTSQGSWWTGRAGCVFPEERPCTPMHPGICQASPFTCRLSITCCFFWMPFPLLAALDYPCLSASLVNISQASAPHLQSHPHLGQGQGSLLLHPMQLEVSLLHSSPGHSSLSINPFSAFSYLLFHP